MRRNGYLLYFWRAKKNEQTGKFPGLKPPGYNIFHAYGIH